jgi:CBS domain-containing protein
MKPRHLTVSDLMTTAVVTVRSNETVGNAHADMQMGMFRHLPVLDERGRLVGILSDRDILRALARPKATLVAEVMTRELVTVKPTTAAHLAAQLMVDRTIGSLPVVNDEGRMIGLLTQTDFLAVARRALLSLPLDGGE